MVKKGKPGPKTAVGKLHSSKNSTKHGLSSSELVGIAQEKIFRATLAELVKHYQPQTPLQKIQLERIAICKTKLRDAYQLEANKLQLIRDEAEIKSFDPKDDGRISKLAIGMMHEMSIFKVLTLPAHLTPNVLEAINAEIEAFQDEVTSDKDLEEYFPVLVKYLDVFDSNQLELHAKLKGVAHILADVIGMEDLYVEHLKTLIPSLGDKPPPVASTVDPEMDELDRYQEGVRERHGLKPIVKVKPLPSFPEPHEIKVWLKSFQEILHAYKEVQIHGDLMERKRQLQLKAVSLPADELELLMRYQVTWEKRLSSAIGEFLQLQKVEK